MLLGHEAGTSPTLRVCCMLQGQYECWCTRSGLRHKNREGRLGSRLNDAFLLVHFYFVVRTVCKRTRCDIEKWGHFDPPHKFRSNQLNFMQCVPRDNFVPANFSRRNGDVIRGTVAAIQVPTLYLYNVFPTFRSS